jgi:predicted GNAT superfamily acetyltransferase
VYDEVEAVAATRGRMALEVNLVPPNPASMAFHLRRGYVEVGRLGDADHLVVLLTKDLGPT